MEFKLTLNTNLMPNILSLSLSTSQARSPVETRLKEAQEFQRGLEKKLVEAEKEKQELREEKRKAVDIVEKQVIWQLYQILSQNIRSHSCG